MEKLLNPTTLGAVVCIAIALADIWHFHALAAGANSLLYVGLGGLLGYTIPSVQARVQAVQKGVEHGNSTVPGN